MLILRKSNADTIEFSNVMLQLRNQRSDSKTVGGFCITLILKGIIAFFVTFTSSEGNFLLFRVISKSVVY